LTSIEIIFGTISSIGVIVGIYYAIKNDKKVNSQNDSIVLKDIEKEKKVISKDKTSIIKNTKKQKEVNIDFKSDKDIRDYIYNAMSNLALVDANFDSLSKKFIGITVHWSIKINHIEKINDTQYKVYFESSSYSRLEYMFINPKEFPNIKFVKKDEEYMVKATIQELEESKLMLDNVISFNKTLEEK
jgi:hypothetical protein